jgi:hypothetical protein
MANNAWRQEKRDRAAAALRAEEEAKRRAMAACNHYDCEAVRFGFDGTVQEVRCRDCGATNSCMKYE